MSLRLLEFFQDRIKFSSAEVYPGLFMSSKISRRGDLEKVKGLGIDTVIDLEGGFDPPMEWLKVYVWWPIHDAPALPNLYLLINICEFGKMEIENKRKVLVHCGQGLNRAGLVCGRIMTLFGLSGNKAVDIIRQKRVGALYNPVFSAYLKDCSLWG